MRQQSDVSNPGNVLDAGNDDGQDSAAAGSNGDDGSGLMVGNGDAGTSAGVSEKLTVKAASSTVTVTLVMPCPR